MDTLKSSGSTLQPLKRKRLSEEISEQLKGSIFAGEFTPGDKLPYEGELSEIFGVGRPVVREALRFLENSGLIQVKPGAGGGAFVKKIGSSTLSNAFEGIVKLDHVSMEELTEARLTVEMAILPLIFERIQPLDLETLEQNIEEAHESLEKISEWADIIVCSGTPEAALTREWKENGLDNIPLVIAGQEMGTKKEQLGLVSGKYPKGRAIMLGDALGDLQAAQANGLLFYPVNPGGEEKSWEFFHNEGADAFRNGKYAENNEAACIAEFKQLLPEIPPWKR